MKAIGGEVLRTLVSVIILISVLLLFVLIIRGMAVA